MIVLYVLFGLLAGWLLTLASDYLPRFAAQPPDSQAVFRPPAALRWFDRGGNRESWFTLHLLVELLTAGFFAGVGARAADPLDTAILLLGGCLFLLIAVIDLKYRLILNVVTYPAMLAVLAGQLFLLHHEPRSLLLGGLLAFGVFFMVSWLKPGQLGGGDVKLAALIGLMFGFPQVLWALLVGGGAGAVAALVLLSRRAGWHYRIPYAPFLCLGGMVVLVVLYALPVS